MRIYSKIALLVTLNLLTVLLIAGMVLVPSKKSVSNAADAAPSYSANWDMTGCRIAKYDNGTTHNKVYLGPSNWKVTYTISASNPIIENWTVSTWSDQIPLGNQGWQGSNISFANSTGNDCKTTKSGILQYNGQYSFSSELYYTDGVGSSYPILWHVATQ